MKPLRIALILTLTAIWVLPVGLVLVEPVDAHPTLSDANGNGLLDIWDVYDLQDMELDLTEAYELRNDIDASVTSGWNGGQGFDPIGADVLNMFTGSLEGNGYTISDLYINRDQQYVGLFGIAASWLDTTYLRNFTLEDIYVRSTFDFISPNNIAYLGGLAANFLVGTVSGVDLTGDIVYVGSGTSCLQNVGGLIAAISGDSNESVLVEDCDVDATITVTYSYDIGIGSFAPHGMIFGMLGGGSVVENCTTDGTIDVIGLNTTCFAGIGGFAGYIKVDPGAPYDIIVTDCHSTVDITVDTDMGYYSGGFFGMITDGDVDIEKCSALSSQTYYGSTSAEAIGGFGNLQISSGGVSIDQCWTDGEINIQNSLVAGFGSFIGGFSAALFEAGGTAAITDSYANVDIIGANGAGTFSGGLVNGNGSVTDVYTIGNIESANEGVYTGTCIVGNPTYTTSFWNVDITGAGPDCTGDGTGETTLNLKTEGTFTGAGWDFANVWTISPSVNDGYPYLQGNPPGPGPGPVPVVPTVTTDYVTHISTDSTTAVGTLTDEGDSEVTTVGFCWNTTGAPTISDSTTFQTGSFVLFTYAMPVESLISNTGYYLRAFATSVEGTGYGNTVEFDTVPNFTDNTTYLDFNPWNLIPPSSPGTISDISGYGNDASYILADMIDGVTIYSSIFLSGGGEFYPSQGNIEVPNKWIVPPQSGMTQQGDSSELPLWDLFDETATDIGIETGLLYILATFSITMGLGFLTYLIIGNILIAIILMIVFLTGFLSTGVMPLWVLIFFVAFAIGLIYVSRQV